MSAPPFVRLLRFAPALLWAAAIFLLSHQTRLPEPPIAFDGLDKVIHAVAYAVGVAAMLVGAGWPLGRTVWWWAVVASLYGATDELHQSFIPGRSADILDWLADSAGAVLFVGVWLQVRRKPET